MTEEKNTSRQKTKLYLMTEELKIYGNSKVLNNYIGI